MLILLLVLLVLGLIAAVIGFAFTGLIWLAIIAIVLFVGTVAMGFVRRNSLRRLLCTLTVPRPPQRTATGSAGTSHCRGSTTAVDPCASTAGLRRCRPPPE
jgi:hypothetical protein